MIRVILVDDHTLIRRGMRDVLGTEEGIEVVGEAGSGAELQVVLGTTPCDVVVLDINLPGPSGLDMLSAMAARPGMPRFLVVSMYPEDQYAVKALRAGAWGYVNKSADSSVMVEAIRMLALGRKFITPTVAGLLVERLATPAATQPHERLSERELQMLVLIAQGQRLQDIADMLELTPKTVSVYRARLLEKMKMSTNAEMAHYAQRNGLVN